VIEPKRLLESGASDFETRLLEAGRRLAPPADLPDRCAGSLAAKLAAGKGPVLTAKPSLWALTRFKVGVAIGIAALQDFALLARARVQVGGEDQSRATAGGGHGHDVSRRWHRRYGDPRLSAELEGRGAHHGAGFRGSFRLCRRARRREECEEKGHA
jgi:hypothetical protein